MPPRITLWARVRRGGIVGKRIGDHGGDSLPDGLAPSNASQATAGCMDTFSVLKILFALSFPPASLAVALMLALVLALVGWRRSAQGDRGPGDCPRDARPFVPADRRRPRPFARGPPARGGGAASAGLLLCCRSLCSAAASSPAHPPEQPLPDLTQIVLDFACRSAQRASILAAVSRPRSSSAEARSVAQQGSPPTTEAEAMRVLPARSPACRQRRSWTSPTR